MVGLLYVFVGLPVSLFVVGWLFLHGFLLLGQLAILVAVALPAAALSWEMKYGRTNMDDDHSSHG